MPELNQLWRQRFSNKTNGVTQRRWLLMANPGLARLLDETVGSGWATDLEQVRGIEPFADASEVQRRFAAVQRANKENPAAVLNRIAGVAVEPTSIFDIQAKRIHECKRQLLMALGIVHEYLALVEDGVEPLAPRTHLFAGQGA